MSKAIIQPVDRHSMTLLGINHFRFCTNFWQDIIWHRHIWVWLASHFVLPHTKHRDISPTVILLNLIYVEQQKKTTGAYIYAIHRHTHAQLLRKKRKSLESHTNVPHILTAKSQTKPNKTKSENTYSTNQSGACIHFVGELKKKNIWPFCL